MSADGLMTVAQVAKKVNRTTGYIRYEVREGRLKAVRIGSVWLIKEEDFEAWQKRRRPRR